MLIFISKDNNWR